MDIINQHTKYINGIIAKVLRIGILLMLIVGYMNAMHIFKIEPFYMNLVVIISIVIFLIPTLLFDVFKLHTMWTQLFVLTLIVLTSGMMYAILSYHVVIMFVVPVCIACLYNDKRYPIFTLLITIPVLIVSHFVALKLHVIVDEPLYTISGVLRFGILPRILQTVGCSLICVAAAKRSHQLIQYLLKAQEKQHQDQEVLKQIIYESELLIGMRQVDDMIRYAAQSTYKILTHMGDDANKEYKALFGYTLNTNENQFILYKGLSQGEEKEEIHAFPYNFKWQEKKLSLIQSYQLGCELSLKDQILSMRFYNDHQLMGFIFVPCYLPATGENMNLLKMLYTNIHETLKNVYLNQEMLTMQKELIQSLAEICEGKSAQTGQHIKRVSEYMKIMGRALDLDEEQCETLSMAAMLHDVGKLKVPDEILEKPGKLTAEEFNEIKKHVQYGKELLANCPGKIMAICKTIAYEHHDKWDGSGYLKLAADEINEYACIVAVIDVFDALVSRRSYKEAWTHQDAYDEIVRSSGTHFSPNAVTLFQKTYPELLKVLVKYPD